MSKSSKKKKAKATSKSSDQKQAKVVSKSLKKMQTKKRSASSATKKIKDRRFQTAVVGMHGRFPAALDIRDFWENQLHGKDAVRFVPAERWDWKTLFGSAADERESTYSNCGGFMPFVDRFDAHFFGILPREAAAMDPQQRLFLQTAWAALEDAGYAPKSLAGRKVGVFVGIGHADYPVLMRRDGAAFDIYRATGMALTCIANRVSFTLDLCGPSESIDTACSSSLVAIHRAIQSMTAGECEIAIVGGVNLLLGPEMFIAFAKAGMLSRTGHCATFDAKADGYVRGEGVAAMVLCPLETAERNKDYIYGVIQGSAENHGGRAHSFTAPNVRAQVEVVQAAWRKAGLPFRQASLIETHGTGTPLGDPIEINALKKIWEDGNNRQGVTDNKVSQGMVLGALKSHIGHLEAAAGIAGVIKSLLAMQHRCIPGNLHYNSLNRHINLDGTPFVVPTDNIPLAAAELAAGVSSFGFGGVNAHVVVQDYGMYAKDAEYTGTGGRLRRLYLVPLSAKDADGLLNRACQLADFLDEPDAGATVSADEETAMLAKLCAALDWPAPAPKAPPITLASLGLSASQWLRVLQELISAMELDMTTAEFRDLVTLQEVARHFAGSVRSKSAIEAVDPDALCCRVAVPPERIRAVTMEQLVHGLKHGRDVMDERIAIIAYGKLDLLAHLRRFIASGEATDPAWVRGSFKNKDTAPAPAKPPLPATWPETGELRTWAEYWVRTKAAVLCWEDLCPGAAVPSKFPLPAYPFRLERFWYKAGWGTELRSPTAETRAAEPVSAGLVESWNTCWRSSPISASASVMALARLLDYRAETDYGLGICLEDIVFSRPMDLAGEALICHSAKQRDVMVVQCLTSGSQPLALVQAAIVPNRAPATTRDENSVHPSSNSLAATAFYDALSDAGLTLAPPFRCIESIKAASGSLTLGVALPKWQAGDGLFWSALLSTILGGVFYLRRQESAAAELLLPWRIDTLIFDSNAAETIDTVTIDLDANSRRANVRVLGANRKPVLSLTGLNLRGVSAAESTVSNLPRQAR